uniref:Uncharacterized protein n=1 Tax=viral metagenome TaxID=1070528 RepID=A0A6C0BCN4_9ZZZZ
MIISISGSRNYDNYDFIKYALDHYKIEKINVGDAKGVDSLVVRYCQEKEIPYEIFNVNWNPVDQITGVGSYDKAAGLKRNYEIIKGTELLIAFPSRYSNGTKHAINIASKNFGIPVHYCYID